MGEERLLYQGKTKDVYEVGGGCVRLQFKDDVTGENGVFDPGANTVGLSISGMGRANLEMSSRLFSLLEKAGVRTHFVSADASRGSMVVKKARPFGQGLEVICRRRAVGSFFRRYGAYIENGAQLDDYVEMTLKDDLRGDPLITREGLIALNILDSGRYDELVALTRRITGILTAWLKDLGLELVDIKYEFGLVGEQLVLMDELSAGNMRVWDQGQSLEALALTGRVLGGDQ